MLTDILKKPAVSRAALLAIGVAGLTLAGSASSAGTPTEHVITMANMSYGTIPTGIKVGDTIVWVNRDTVLHTATARDKSFDLRISQGHSARMTVQKAGAIPFYCIFHSTMRGTLQVAAQ
jgi:plastocyanin